MRVLLTVFLVFLMAGPVHAEDKKTLDEYNAERKAKQEKVQKALDEMSKNTMTIKQAYEAIPHKQTPFSLKQSRLPKADAKYLDHYFFVSDIAMKARVMMLHRFHRKIPNITLAAYNKEINDAITTFDFAKTPPHLQEAQNLLISAIRDQQAFFNEWAKAHGTAKFESLKRNYTSHAKVQSAHGKLIQAYYLIKAQYPREVEHNVTAFFDHLCALDFI